jgi:hypothetical protein
MVGGKGTGDLRPPSEPRITKEQLVELEDRMRLRITDLERDNRSLKLISRWLAVGLLVPIVLAIVLFIAAPALIIPGSGFDSVESRRFVLRDDNGVIRGEWTIAEDGASRLSINDPSGNPRLNLSVLEGGSPGLSLSDNSGQRLVALGSLDQTSTLVFADADGMPRAVLGLPGDGSSSLVFADAGGITRVGMSVDQSGTSSVMLPIEEAEEPVPQREGLQRDPPPME